VSFGQVGPDAGLSGSTTVFEHQTAAVLTFPGGLFQSTALLSINGIYAVELTLSWCRLRFSKGWLTEPIKVLS
jgi:hypothetical protein